MKREKLYISTIDPKAGDLARRFGTGIEIAEYCTAWNMDREFELTDVQVKSSIQDVERRILHAPFNELHPCAIDPLARELAARRFHQALALAKDYDCCKVVIHGGFLPHAYYPSWYVPESISFWQEFMKTAPEGIQIVLENVLEDKAEYLLDIVQTVNDPRLRLCLDIGHANAYSKEPVEKWVESWGSWIGHFHIHNNDGTWDSHSPLDCGSIPIGEVLQLGDALCPNATYTLELTDAEGSVRALLEE